MITGNFRKSKLTSLRDGNGKIITEQAGVLQEWKNYAEKLFDDVRTEAADSNAIEGPEILESEVIYAIKCMKNRKAPGTDEIPAELIKCVVTKFLTIIFNKIYSSGNMPKDWLKSIFVPIPKRSKRKVLLRIQTHLINESYAQGIFKNYTWKNLQKM